MKPFITVVIKPTLFCNTNCKHCYHTPEERVKGNISLDKVEKLIKLVSEEYQTAWFIWHGGEPLTLPMSFYKEVIGYEEKYFGKDSMRIGNTINTNGTLLNRRLMAYCREKKINIGVSYEGPYNNVLREEDVEKTLKTLTAKDNKYAVSATISKDTASKQKEIYEYFRDKAVSVSLSPVMGAGCGKCYIPDTDEFIKGSIEAFDDWLFDNKVTVPLMPFYLYIQHYLGEPVPSDCAHTSCLTKWICMYPDGSLYPCAKACPKDFCMGNIDDIGSINDAFQSEGFRNILIGSIKRREKCSSCEIFNYCNGGCSIDACYENGIEENGGQSCRAYKEIFGHVSKEIQKILDEKPDMDRYNPYVKEAIVNKLINPKTISQ
ncbi:MAG: radical SAM protein [Candidatus Methanomethylophilaceae archaeon]|nr:radical SAM protein [Candidatus Methanomethylophilaceae archaeon]